MRTKLILLICLLAPLLMLTGCDFLRTVAGRPTSADLQAKLESINRFSFKEETAVKDTVAAVRDTLKQNPEQVDSTQVVLEQIPAAQNQAVETAPQAQPVPEKEQPAAGPVRTRPPYYVIVGTFSVRENAEKYVSELQGKGYQAKAFPSRGMVAVGVYPDDPTVPSDTFLSKVLSDPSFPRDAWAYYPKH